MFINKKLALATILAPALLIGSAYAAEPGFYLGASGGQTTVDGDAGSFGFDAITVALLGRAQPLGTVFAALLFGALHAGGRTMQSNTGVPLDIVLVTQALIVLFIAAPTFVRFIFRLKKLNSSAGLSSKGWNG